ncbi:hypothetical protein Hanom_Chr02g00149521 [Helianthus anomalus]
MSLYSEGKKGATLKYIHCWHIAKKPPKWAGVPLVGQSSSKRSKSCSSTSRSDARTDFEIKLSDNDFEAEQPPGRVSKKKRAQKSSTTSDEKTPLWSASKKKSMCLKTYNKKETLRK